MLWHVEGKITGGKTRPSGRCLYDGGEGEKTRGSKRRRWGTKQDRSDSGGVCVCVCASLTESLVLVARASSVTVAVAHSNH